MFTDVLKGVKVVELATYVAAPGAGRILSEWGAEVIKVESGGGDPWRYFGPTMGVPIADDENPYYDLSNANKKGIVINLKSPEGQEVFHRLLADADVFLTNVRGASLKKQGIDYETLHEKYPKLVWAHVTGQGSDGPDADLAGYDITSYWARGGGLIDFVNPGALPLNSPSGLADHSTNYVIAAGICGALVKQRTTGIGSRVTASLYGLAVWANALYAISTQYGQQYPSNRYEGFNPLMTAYCCSDGEWIQIVAPTFPVDFPKMCKILGLEHLIGDPRFESMAAMIKGGHRGDLIRMMEEAFLKKDSIEYARLLTEADVAFAPVRHFKDIATDCQALANNYVVKHTFKSGNTIMLPAGAVQFDSKEEPPHAWAPLVGEHTTEILQAYGYSDEEIAKLHESGAVKSSK